MSTMESNWRRRSDRLVGWAAIAVWSVFFGVLGWKAATQPNERSTYPAFVGGAEAWLARDNLYQPKHRVTGFRYGPAFAVSMIPLAVIPQWLGSLLWSWLNVVALLIGAWLLADWVLPGLEPGKRRAVFFLLLLPAAVRTLWSAQSNALVFALVACAAAAIVNKRWWLAALLLAIPVHIKVWPLAAGLLMCACWPRQLIARYAACLLAVGAAPLLAADASYVLQQYRNWYALLTGPALDRHIYRDAWTIWEVFWPPVNAQVYSLLQLASALAVLAVCLWKARQWRQGTSADQQHSASPMLVSAAMGSNSSRTQQMVNKSPTAQSATQRQQSTSAYKAKLLTFILSMWAAWQLTFGPGTERNTFGLIAPLNAWAILTAARQPCAPLLMVPASLLMTLANSGELERRLPDYPVVKAIHPLAVLAFAVWMCAFWVARAARSSQSGLLRPIGDQEIQQRKPIMLSCNKSTSSGDVTTPKAGTNTGSNRLLGDLLSTAEPARRQRVGQGSAHESTALRFGPVAGSTQRSGRRNRCTGGGAQSPPTVPAIVADGG